MCFVGFGGLAFCVCVILCNLDFLCFLLLLVFGELNLGILLLVGLL